MQFYKMSGAGNDFIVLKDLDGSISPADRVRLAQILCRRRLSIGADGLMIVGPSDKADFCMDFYNADGSVGEMCGNGARCICRYGHDTGLAGDVQTVETMSGLVTGRRLDQRRYRIGLTAPTLIDMSRPVEIGGISYPCVYIELGTPGLPHAVLEVPGLVERDEKELFALGQALRWHPSFPKGANVNFYDLTGPDEAVLRTFERGVEGFTYACGTGSAATALTIALRAGGLGRTVMLHNTGGDLEVEVLPGQDGDPAELYLTGPTNIVAIGEVTDEDL